MKKTERKIWRENTIFSSEFKDGTNCLRISVIHRYEGESPNANQHAFLEFFGDCEDGDGEIVKKRKKYEITQRTATEFVEAMEGLARYDQVRHRPEFAREYFRQLSEGFVVSLKHSTEPTFFVLSHEADGWKFEAADRNGLFDAFCNAAR
jgi:hypothetical protein